MPKFDLPAALQKSYRLHQSGGTAFVVKLNWESAFNIPAILDGLALSQWGTERKHRLRGRGPIHVLATPKGEIVAKRLERGGVVGSLLRGWYFDWRRPLREAELSEQLLGLGCPTPKVLAVRITRAAGCLHALEIATARVSGGQDPVESVHSGIDPGKIAAQIGKLLRKAHDVGLCHRDLQVSNFLFVDGEDVPQSALILDLDRCRRDIRGVNRQKRLADLTRLGRSLAKVLRMGRLRDQAGLSARLARHFFTAYGSMGGQSPVQLLRSTSRSVRRSVFWHGFLWRSPKRRPSQNSSEKTVNP
ncbi:MAG: lipopolysaccharide kinase InaA family protein [Planctomycetota bacterium]